MTGEEVDTDNLPNIPEHVLHDLCSRFLINIPTNEKNDMVRICFQIELAHWYYIDFCRQEDPDLPPCGMKAFISKIFTDFSFLNNSKDSIQTIYENWKMYKVRVPVFGAILLDESLENCLLVQGYHNKTSWGFPKGKVNKDEGDLECAIREVWEEVGFDIAPLANADQFLENNFHDHQIRLYIIPGVPGDYDFKPNTRGEIKEIRWFPVEFLPTHKKDTAPKEEFGLMANNFFMIHSFIKPLRKWIGEKKNNMSSLRINPLYSSQAVGMNKDKEDKKADEKKEQLRIQRKEKEAEEFKRMHMLLNPLRSSKDDEVVLKSMLGLSSETSNISNSSQPEAIRKLLTGTVSPVVTTEDSRYHPASHDIPRMKESRSSPHGFRIGGSPKKDRTDNKDQNFRSRNLRDSPVQHPQKNQTGDLPNKHQFRPFSPAQNSPKHVNGEAAYKPHHYRAFSPSEDKRNKLNRTSQDNKYQGKNAGRHTPKKYNSSSEHYGDFNFSSPTFASFRLNYDEILSAQRSIITIT